MTLTVRSIRLRLLSRAGSALPGATVSAQLTDYQVDGSDVVPLAWAFTEDPAVPGDYTASLWPNTRGSGGTQYLITADAGDQRMQAQLHTITPTSGVIVMEVNPTPWPPVYAADAIVEAAQFFADGAGQSASLALAAAAGLGDVSSAVATAQAAAGAAAAAEAQRLAFEDRVYPGVYSSPPSAKPHSGLPSAEGDRCSIQIAGVVYEHLRSGGGWVIPNVDSVMLAQSSGASLIGHGPGGTVQRTFEGLGLVFGRTSATRNAVEDTAAIQAYLNKGGLVVLPPPVGGYYLLNDSLVIKSKTRLVLLPGAQLKQAANVNKSLIVNECLTRAWADITGQVFWLGGAGFKLLVTWPGHGLMVGDAVWLDCENSYQYCGIFTVEELVGSTDFVLRLDREPVGNPEGIVRIKRADVDIAVHGLDLDYNAAENTDGAQTPMTHASIFAGIRGFQLAGVKGRNTKKYLVCTAGLKHFKITDIQGYRLNSDMVKIYGPAHDGDVLGLTGQSGDDMLSFQPREYAAFAPYRLSFGGDIIGVRGNVRMTGGEDGVAVAASFYPTPGAVIDGIELLDFSGYSDGTGISIYQYEGEGGYIGTVKLRNFGLRCKHPLRATQGAAATSATRIKHLDFEMGPECRAITGAAILDIDNGVTVEDLTVRGADVSRTNLPEIGLSPLLMVQGSGDVTGAIVLDKLNWRAAASYLIDFTGADKSFRSLDFFGCDIETTYDAVHGSAKFVNEPTITVHGGRLKSYFTFELQSACRLNFLGTRLEPSQKVINAYGDSPGTIVLDSKGAHLASGEWIAASGAKKISPRSFDILANLEADYMQRAVGNMCTATGAAGTIPALMPCVCVGPGANSWHGMSDPASQKY